MKTVLTTLTLLTLSLPSVLSHSFEVVALPVVPNSKRDVHKLFQKRQNGNYPPEDVPGPNPLPAWVTAYNNAKAAGLIPSIPPSVKSASGMISYNGIDGTSQSVCSWTVGKCYEPTDIWNGPNGTISISFDDGPQLPSPTLYTFLQQNNISATHFMIGSRIEDNPTIFAQAISTGGQIAVHTWSHPSMTTLTDQQVVGELGWTMQIIYDKANGRLPNLWRPPYGDVDARVRAIAKSVFGLTTVIWNHDSNDWCLTDNNPSAVCAPGSGPQNQNDLNNELAGWINGPQSPGLILLEHELSSHTVQGFLTAYPLMKAKGWITKSIPDTFNLAYYQNALNNLSPVQSGAIGVLSSIAPSTSSSSSVVSSTSTTPSSTSSMASSVSSSVASTSPSTAVPVQNNTGGTFFKGTARTAIVAAAIALAVLIIGFIVFVVARKKGWCCFKRRTRTSPKTYPQNNDIYYSDRPSSMYQRGATPASDYTINHINSSRNDLSNYHHNESEYTINGLNASSYSLNDYRSPSRHSLTAPPSTPPGLANDRYNYGRREGTVSPTPHGVAAHTIPLLNQNSRF